MAGERGSEEPAPDRAPDTVGLVRRAQHGDRLAIEMALARLRPRLERWIAARLGSRLRSRLDVEDVLQETLVAVWQGIEKARFDSGKDLFAWIVRVAEHRIADVYDHHRAKKRDAAREETLQRALLATRTGPATSMDRESRRERVLVALARLPTPDREVIRLCRIEGRSNGEVGELLGAAPGTVAVRLFRALKRLESTIRDLPGATSAMDP